MVKEKIVKINQLFEKIIKEQSVLAQLNELKNAIIPPRIPELKNDIF